MSWIERILNKSNITQTRKASIPEGVWTKCDSCGQVLYRAELERNLEVCPKCDHHMRMSARARLHTLLDEGSEVELGSDLEPKDVLKFKDSKRYKDRLVAAQKATGEKDALVVMKGTLYGMPIVAASFEFAFIGGSMSSVVGARFVRAVEQALEDNCPLVCFSASGGARMMTAAKEALVSYGADAPLLIAVTVLTSMEAEDLRGIGIEASPAEHAERLARLTRDCGLDGVVCSAHEAQRLKAACGQVFQLVTPGIRPEGSAAGDQRRIMTPVQAQAAGVDYMVIGRPITQSADPAATLRAIRASLA